MQQRYVLEQRQQVIARRVGERVAEQQGFPAEERDASGCCPVDDRDRFGYWAGRDFIVELYAGALHLPVGDDVVRRAAVEYGQIAVFAHAAVLGDLGPVPKARLQTIGELLGIHDAAASAPVGILLSIYWHTVGVLLCLYCRPQIEEAGRRLGAELLPSCPSGPGHAVLAV